MSGPRAPGDRTTHVAICIPARNEALRLPRLFEAMAALDWRGSWTLCLLLDGCTDDSARLAEAYRRQARFDLRVGHAPPAAASNAGLARHRAMMLGLSTLSSPHDVLLTSDADSWPQTDWIKTMVAALDQSDLVAGRVIRAGHRASPDQDRVERYYDRLFALRRRIDPVIWEASVTHHYGSGANMGLRAGTYRRLGGFAPLASGEDGRLIDDAARAGLRVRRDAASVVHTSDRRSGRAPSGLAEALHRLDREGLAGIAVAHPADQLWQYRAHAIARRGFADREFAALSAMIGLDDDHLVGVARDAPNAEGFAMRMVPVPPGGMRTLPFPMAEAILAGLTTHWSERAA
ncbi:glycosyltransferase [Sphingomonas sp.]|uniref:glycosyltransferase n=1 Tax=Sphingomonas sp. TaxID=28214 RepID=UPI00289A91A3|nr:glycosyltransferase [Sphingomonas sp.]